MARESYRPAICMSDHDRPSILVPMTAGRRARAAAPPPQPMLFDVGERAPGRHPDDFYGTPAWVTDLILPFLPLAGTIVEPSCGDGAILARVAIARPRGCLRGFELNPERAEQARVRVPSAEVRTGDFLHWAEHNTIDDVGLIIGNPPFTFAQEFVEACIGLAAPTRGTVAMLLRLAFIESEERACFHAAHPSDVYPLANRPSFTGDGTDSAAYGWFVWGPGRGGRMFAPLRSGGVR
jgi:hypothetical protein